MIDQSDCSFSIPTFTSDADERAWSASLTEDQRWELFRFLQVARWGEAVLRGPMDRAAVEVLTMDDFRAMKEAQFAADQEWRQVNGCPPVMPMGNGGQ